MATLGGRNSAPARGSSEPNRATDTGSQRATASDTSAASPAMVSDSRRPSAWATSPHHQLPSAIPPNENVW